MPSQRIPGITMTRVLIVVLALLAAGLAMWRVSTTAPAPEAPYFPPGHMQITANNRATIPDQPEKPSEVEGSSVASVVTPQISPAPAVVTASKGVETAPSMGEVQTALAAWKIAWESRDVDTYMMFYHQSFPDRNAFMRQKSGVMGRAKTIRIDVQDLKVTVDARKTRAVFLQHYQSDTYRSKDIKTQLWVSGPDGPKIIEETIRARRGSEGE